MIAEEGSLSSEGLDGPLVILDKCEVLFRHPTAPSESILVCRYRQSSNGQQEIIGFRRGRKELKNDLARLILRILEPGQDEALREALQQSLP